MLRPLGLLVAIAAAAGCASTTLPLPAGDRVLGARDERTVAWDEMIDDLASVRVVYVGESHTNPEHHAIQLRILEALAARRPRLLVGMEMLQRPYQPVLDRWSEGGMDEATFLREANWYGQWSDWRLYGPILRAARDRHARVIALNTEWNTVVEIGKVGLDGLPPWKRAQLPEVIDTSVAAHRKAIREVFFGHPGMEKIEGIEDRFRRFYEAQCTLDEVMAESVAQALAGEPSDAAIVVLAGGMHVRDFHAMPERVRRRNGLDYRVVLPVDRDDEDAVKGIRVGMGRPADYVLATAPTPPTANGRLGVVLRGGDATVADVTTGGAAAAAGLRKGDVLLAVDGAPIADTVDIRLALEGRIAGDRVKLRWTREGTAMEGEGAIPAPPSMGPPPPPKPEKPAEKAGERK